ncbi:4Fe-4S dicluster domain-containing protein [Spirosoma fluviale]|uniref:Formate hydrogenlyase subunit 6/NADH:ubiquinone oxidoreductase subunit (Chain I) n=1 Tax=Spirosoma fluviale TaxID=1597977 RepID=A0A286GII5_9BACT|nr:4Fe-4S dicluster domain-containing protein [Spirosoma fluviale]SOD95036.1 Formate hydrogenlyase subunit 6/NADH:ubiquinone oxidoreductase subunit (chain I) [Spirosoma fluviale]
MSYFKDIQSGIRTTLKGLSLTLRHLRNATKRRTAEGIASDSYFDLQNGLVTLQYPYEQLPIPDNGRYRLRNEIEDCIVCDKCAKVCPVDCITIDAIKATEEVGRASDGSPIRLYAAKFDIDMAKCCYCGLCTVVCPTECLTMDKKFDYSEFELGKLTYNFSNLTPEQADEKRTLYEQFLREKDEARAAQVAAKAAATPEAGASAPAPKRPVFKPTAKPAAPPAEPHEPANSEGSSIEHPLTDATPDEMQQIAQGGLEAAKRPVFRPTKKPEVSVTDVPANDLPASQPTLADVPETPKPAAKPPGFRPTMKPPVTKPAEPLAELQPEAPAPAEAPKPKPAFRPTMKPPVAKAAEPQEDVQPEAAAPAVEAPKKPAFRPTMKPPTVAKTEPDAPQAPSPEPEVPKAKPAFKPTMKPPKPAEPESSSPAETPKPKPAFRPTMKPAVVPQPPVEESPAPLPAPELKAEEPTIPDSEPVKPKPAAFRPTMKPRPKADDASDTPSQSDQ